MEEKTLYLPTEHNDRIVAFIGSPLGLLAAWLVLINTVTFLIFGVDKLLAKHPRFRQRVPEKNLLLLAVVGGSVGALLGMYLFRHKTLHRVFRVGVPVILAVQLLLAAAIALYWNFLRSSCSEKSPASFVRRGFAYFRRAAPAAAGTRPSAGPPPAGWCNPPVRC